MMYNEFLELIGKSESYISYKEYTEEIEPIYMACDLPTKQDFIKLFNEMLKEALKTLDAEEQMIIKKKLYGYSDEEIYKSMGISVKKYNQILDRLIKAVEEVMYDV